MKKFKPFHGPARFVFKDPDTGYQYSGTTKQQLVDHIITYREQNRLPLIDNLLIILENYWCGLPENEGSCDTAQLHRGFLAYLKGGITMIENVFFGDKNMVSVQEASVRAEICLPCPLNVFPDKQGFLRWSDDIAEHSTNDRFRELSDKLRTNLGSCQGCTCTLKAKVFMKPNLLWAHPFKLSEAEETQMREANSICWQLRENIPQ